MATQTKKTNKCMRYDARTTQSIMAERNGQAMRVNIEAPYGGLNTRDKVLLY